MFVNIAFLFQHGTFSCVLTSMCVCCFLEASPLLSSPRERSLERGERREERGERREERRGERGEERGGERRERGERREERGERREERGEERGERGTLLLTVHSCLSEEEWEELKLKRWKSDRFWGRGGEEKGRRKGRVRGRWKLSGRYERCKNGYFLAIDSAFMPLWRGMRSIEVKTLK